MPPALAPASGAPAARRPARARAHRLLAALLLAAAPALARPEPTFTFEKPKEGAAAAWSGSLRAGACLSGGNAAAVGLSAEGTLARTSPRDRLLLTAAGAYARSRVAVAEESNGVPGLGPDEVREVQRTTKENGAARLRYDRFIGARGSAYVLLAAGVDEPAGKRLVLGAQAGYGMDLIHEQSQTLRLELGYDLSREDDVAPAPRLEIHSARLFAGWSGALGGPARLAGSLELLTNLNAERGTPGGPAGPRPLRDTRVNARLALEVKLNGTLSTGARATAAYDAAPAPRPPPAGSAWAAGYAPLADRLDTTAEWFVAAKF